MKDIAVRTIMAAVVAAHISAATVTFASMAAAKGQEGGITCTGRELADGTCKPQPLRSTPIGAIPLGCKPNGHETIACGRRGFHVGSGSG
jgi:hypothetical protein